MSRFIENYLHRHQTLTNRLLHLIGVPMSFGLSVYCLIFRDWQLALGSFVGGYVLQFLGHTVEGNDPGELILLKRLLHRPYRQFGPRTPQGQLEEQSKSAG